jgi:hypothetical protein
MAKHPPIAVDPASATDVTPKGVALRVETVYAYPDGSTWIFLAGDRNGRQFRSQALAIAWFATTLDDLHRKAKKAHA